MALGNDQVYRELAYEALSRGRLSNHVYIPQSCLLDIEDGPHAPIADPPDPLESLEQALRRRRAKHMALDEISTMPLSAWTTTDLLDERDRVRAVLDEAPADRRSDIEALTKSRRQASLQLTIVSQDVERLAARKRPLRERRRPDVERLAAASEQVRLSDRVNRLDVEIRQAELDQQRRELHLAAHRTEALELRAIEGTLRGRTSKAIARVVSDPPTYITRTLGPRPAGTQADRAWIKGVMAIEAYRTEHDVSDKRTTLGAQPCDARGTLDWWAIQEAIGAAKNAVNIPNLDAGKLVPGLELPSLGCGR